MAPGVRALARARLERLLDDPTPDFAEFAAALPHDVMCEVVGIPATDRDAIRADNDLLNHCEDGVDTRSGAAIAAGFRLAMYYVGVVSDRRKHPRDDFTSAMIEAGVDGEPLTDSQLVAFLFLLVSATNESTGKQIGLALYRGWRHPEVRSAGLNGRAADWRNESLRFDSASQMMARTLTKETVIHGTRLGAGARIVLLPASGNRDPRAFTEPDTFDLDRDTSKMLSFGHGPHFCLGSALAQLEITVALEELGSLVSDYEIDMEAARWIHSPHQRGFASLPGTATCRPQFR
jgi:cytochrome P450